MKKKKKKEQANLTQLGGGEDDEQRWSGGHGSVAWWTPISTDFVLTATSISTSDGTADELSLSLSLMWSKFEMLECSWGEKENKRRGAGHLGGGEKQAKEKRKKEMKRVRMKMKWKEEK